MKAILLVGIQNGWPDYLIICHILWVQEGLEP